MSNINNFLIKYSSVMMYMTAAFVVTGLFLLVLRVLIMLILLIIGGIL